MEGFAIELANLRSEIADFHRDFVSRKRASAGFALLICEDTVGKIIRRKSVPLSSDPAERGKQLFERANAMIVHYLTGNEGARAALYQGKASKEDKAALKSAVERLRPLVSCVYRELLCLVGPEMPPPGLTVNQQFNKAVGAVQVGDNNRADVAQEPEESNKAPLDEKNSPPTSYYQGIAPSDIARPWGRRRR